MAAANPIKTIPFQGGCNTAIEPALLPPGGYSLIQNMRGQHPGFETRKGQIALHTTADSTNQVKSLYPFCKGRRSEDHLFAQMGDSATSWRPPTCRRRHHRGIRSRGIQRGREPATGFLANLLDNLLFSNGVDQHQIWPGTLSYVIGFDLYQGTPAMPSIPNIGKDYTDEVTDGLFNDRRRGRRSGDQRRRCDL